LHVAAAHHHISKWATPDGVAHRFVAIAVANGR
jgi:hypothetical protein